MQEIFVIIIVVIGILILVVTGDNGEDDDHHRHHYHHSLHSLFHIGKQHAHNLTLGGGLEVGILGGWGVEG